jgi:tRNA(fMet)-specific endonuclease VapC
MGLILDTSVIIRAERLSQTVPEILKIENVGISVVTVSELFVGLHLSNSPRRRLGRQEFLSRVVEQTEIFPFTTEIAKVHAKLRAGLVRRGSVIGAHDLIIAATALHLGWAVKTANESEFRRVEGLEVISA